MMDILKNRNKKQYKKTVDGMFSAVSCRAQKGKIGRKNDIINSVWQDICFKAQKISRLFKRAKYKKAYTAILVMLMITALVFKDTPSIYGATYYWNQTSWSGGQTSNNALHPGGQNGWNEFSTKDSFVKTVNSGAEVELDWTAGSSTQTSDTGLEDTHNAGGFNAGIHSQTKTRGAGTGARVDLSYSGVSAISAGSNYTLAIKSDNSVWSWGENSTGQLGDKTLFERYTPVQVLGLNGVGYLSDIEMISAGTSHSLALKSDGTVWAWGSNNNGQLGNNTTAMKNTPIQVVGPSGSGFLNNIIAISAGDNFSMALKSDGTVWSWGKNDVGQLGDNSIAQKNLPVQVVGVGAAGLLSSVGSISAGSAHALALKSDGTVLSWGKNTVGQLGNNQIIDSSSPVGVVGVGGTGMLSSVTAISASGGLSSGTVGHSLALRSDGTVVSWGRNDMGQLGDQTKIDKKIPVQVADTTGTSFLTNIVSIATGNRFSLAVKDDGKAWAWGVNTTGQLGDNLLGERTRPFQILDTGASGNITQVSAIDGGDGHSVVFKSDATGSVWSWGKNDKGQLGDNTVTNVRTAIRGMGPASGSLPNVQRVSSGQSHSLARKTDGSVWSWGWNGNGQLGVTAGSYRLTPVQVRGPGGIGNLEGISEVAAGSYHSMALRSSDGTVWAWGRGSAGQLGNGGGSSSYSPVQVKDAAGTGFLTNIIAISASEDFSMALRNDGTVWTWGTNNEGQLGNNTVDSNVHSLPVQVLGTGGIGFLTNVMDISAGSNFALAAKNDGTVWAWGNNSFGKLGDNTTTRRPAPIQTLNITGVSKVAAGYAHSMALTNTGTVWAWGWNGNGQLGEGTNVANILIPNQVKDAAGTGFLTGISKIAAGSNHSLAMTNTFTLFAWGLNGNGQLGNNSTANRNLPVQVLDSTGLAGLANVSYIAGGSISSMAIKSDDGLVWNWGVNSYGELGNNRADNSSLPVAVWNSASGYLGLGKTIYNSSGSFISAVVDTKSIRTYSTLNYSVNAPVGTAIAVDVRSGSSSTVDGSWTGWTSNISSGDSIASFGEKRYYQFRTNLSTANADVTPSLRDITFNYYSFPSPGYFVSSAYNTSDASNVLSKVRWNETLQAGTDMNFRVRTAPDNSGVPGVWTSWLGPDGTTNTFFTDKTGGETTPSIVKDGVGDQWIQYQAILISDGVRSPTLEDVTIQYVVNAPPELQNIVASQGADGVVTIDFDVRDPDTDFPSNNTPGTLIMNLQYCTANCSVSGSEVWANATTIAGDVGAGVAVEEVDWTTYQMTWNAKTDYPEIYNSAANFKVRVRADDSEGANNLGYGKSNGFILDTKNPTNVSFSINNNENKLYLATPIDNSAYQMMASNFADFNDTSYGVFSTEHNYPNLTSDPATVYLRIKDAYGNYTTTTETTPAKLRNIVFYDISNNATTEYRELISWEMAGVLEVGAGFSKYNVWRSTDGVNYSILNSITDRSINYYLDQGLTTGTQYYYKVSVEDIHGNINEFSDVVDDSPDGQGGANATPPIISNVSQPPISVSSNSATITWDTDMPSNSTVGYSTASGNYDTEVGVGTLATVGHSVTVTGLAQNTTYYFRVKSADVDDNLAVDDNAGAGYSFTTLPGDVTQPVIGDRAVNNISSRSATIEWTTDEMATSFVEYSTTSGFSTGTVNGTYALSLVHSVVLPSELVPDTTYYYKIHSKDASGNEAISSEGSFQTLSLGDITDPIISGVNPSNIFHNSVIIDWTTDEPATSYVEYGTTILYGSIYGNESLLTSHSVAIPSTLLPETLYHYRVHSKDASGNEAISGDYTFTTLVDPQDIVAPVLVSGPSVAGLTSTSATITWTTDEVSSSVVGYSQSSGSFLLEQGSATMVTTHSVTLVDLLPETSYFYQIKSEDPSGNMMTENNGGAGFSFTTSAGTAPVISDIQATENAYDDFTITWTTDLDSDSFVEFGTTSGVYGSVVGKYDSIKSHTINLDNLLPETTYYYRVRSAGEFEAVSGENSFLTGEVPPPPTITLISASPILHNTATITWTTDLDATSYVDYGVDASYGRTYGDSTLTKNHSVVLPADLLADTVYHYRVRSEDATKNEGASGDNNFQTASTPIPDVPQITSVIATPSYNTATITWTTDVDADSYVEYGIDTGYGRGLYGNDTLTKSHSVILPADLAANTLHHYRVHSTDVANNEGTSSDYMFTTTLAPVPGVPVITNIIINPITHNTATIAWTTDLDSDSYVEYGTDTGYGRTYGNNVLTKNHSVVLPADLAASTVYHFRVHSSDSSNNEGISADNSFTTTPAPIPGTPVISSVSSSAITYETATITWVTDVDSDSYVEYGIDTNYGRTYGNDVLTKNHSITLPADLLEDTEYHYRVHSSDVANSEGISGDYSFHTTLAPVPGVPIISAVSASAITHNTTTITWTTDLDSDSYVEYGTDTSYGSTFGYGALTKSHSVNLPANLVADTTYHYRVHSTDVADNEGISGDYSFTTNTAPVPGVPIISAVSASPISYNTATITWTTDLDASSYVEYGIDIGYGRTYGDATLTKNHSVVIPADLAPDTLHHYRVHSSTSENVEATSGDYSFTTTLAPVPGVPVITGVTTSLISYNTATVTWTTDIDSDSYVEYGADTSYGRIYGNVTQTRNHSIIIPADLTANTLYHYRVRSSDVGNNEGISGDFSFTTALAPVPGTPVITSVVTSFVSHNTATITWTTDIDSDSYVEYGIDTSYGKSFGNDVLTRSHSVVLPADLLALTNYHFRVHSKDATNNEGISGDNNFTTIATPVPNNPVITAVSVSSVSHNTAIINWTTDVNSNSYVEYGVSASYGRVYGNNVLTRNHSIVLPADLAVSTSYRFRVRSADASKNEGISGDYGFVTTAAPVPAVPIITAVTASSITYSGATITWTTDINADSYVEYGTTVSYGRVYGNVTQTRNHTVVLPMDLAANTNYFYRVHSSDSAKNKGTSIGYTFRTALAPVPAVPIISGVAVASVSHDTATITWTTDLDANSYVEYGTTVSYGRLYGSDVLTKNHTVSLPTDLVASTLHHFRVHSTEVGKNKATSADFNFTTLPTPVPNVPIISAVSASPISYNTATITWTTDLDSDSYVEYGTDTSYGRMYGNGTLTKVHGVILPLDLSPSTTYHFRVHSTDNANNKGISMDYSFATIPSPVPGVPVITSIVINPITHNTATITWTTDIDADSFVEYGATAGYGRIYGSFGSTKNHSVTLPADLAPNTPYHFRVHSSDEDGNEEVSGDNNFTTTNAPDVIKPTITVLPYTNLTESAVRINWTTDENTNSIVYVGTSTNYNLISGSESALEQIHGVDVTGLSPATTYHFQVASKDASYNVSYSDDYTFTTLALAGSPQITDGPNENQLLDVSVHIAWTTDQNASSKIVYGLSATELIYSKSVDELVLAHDVFLSGLTEQTEYFYKVISVNAGDVSVESAVENFTTDINADQKHPPLTKIENIFANQKSTSAKIAFNTDQKAKCSVEYRLDGQTYSGLIEGEIDYNTNHSVGLSNLTPKTKYFLKITCEDNLNPPTVVTDNSNPEFSFLTNDSSGNDGDTDITPPSISGIKVGKAKTGDGSLVSWSTDELASSFVRYGLTTDLGSVAGDDLVSFDKTKFVTSHEVIINNLTSNAKYYYAIVSTDEAGNIAISATNTFTTASQSDLSSIKIEAVTLGEALVTWSTNALTTSVVEFGITTAYGQTRQDNSSVKEHKITISGLTAGTVYHIRVRSKDKDGKEYVSSDYTFTPKSPPTISGVSVTEQNEHGATISFTTNLPTDSVIQYTDIKNPKNTGSQGSPELLTVHKVVLHDLTPGTTFAMKINVRDESGTETEQESVNFSTNKDETAPVIDQVRVESALAQNEKVQTIISWTTNEDASTKVIYREGKNGEDTDLPTNDGVSQAHIAVITNFKPGVIYFFNVKSTDKYGNEAISDTYATLTPKKKENIIQIIVNNFQEIFKWTNV